jgi:hypothetical protein
VVESGDRVTLVFLIADTNAMWSRHITNTRLIDEIPQIRIFGDDQHMGDWPLGVILRRWVELSGTPSPRTPPPSAEA